MNDLHVCDVMNCVCLTGLGVPWYLSASGCRVRVAKYDVSGLGELWYLSASGYRGYVMICGRGAVVYVRPRAMTCDPGCCGICPPPRYRDL